MALYGGQRDISLFRHVNRELMGNVISQECVYYKYKLGETKVNLYGEAADGKYYDQADYFGADLVPEVGDIIYYYGGYYEVDDIVGNQYFVGKDPDYNYAVNPINPGLENFGSDLSIVCKTHYTPVDKVQIEKGRING